MEVDNTTLSLAMGFLIGLGISEIGAKFIINNSSKSYLNKKVEEYCGENGIPYNPEDYQFTFI